MDDVEYQEYLALKVAEHKAMGVAKLVKAREEARMRTHSVVWLAGYLKRTYSLTIEQYNAMAERGCAICGSVPDASRLAVDHDHACCPGKTSCGKCVRGVLCGRCNTGLGGFRDDPTRLRAAADYLEKKISV